MFSAKKRVLIRVAFPLLMRMTKRDEELEGGELELYLTQIMAFLLLLKAECHNFF